MAAGGKPDKTGSSIAGLIAIILAWCALHAFGGWTATSSRSAQDHGLRVQAQSIGDGTGAMVVTVEGCEDQATSLDRLRMVIHASDGRVVREELHDVQAGVAAQTEEVGRQLPKGRYYVEAICLANGRPTGKSGTTNTVGERTRVERARQTTTTEPNPQLPHSGR